VLQGQEPLEPDASLSHAANYLYMLDGEKPSDERVRALNTYLNTVIDHGFNASTFTARVIASTHSDMIAAVVGAIGALKGPIHGGAPGPALDMVFEIGKPENAESYLRHKLEASERLMGFGHRVYKVRDPRADVLNAAAERFFTDGEQLTLYRLARHVEALAIKLLEEYKPGRQLQTNVEFYTALVLHGVGLEADLFTPTIAIARVGGWTAHANEHLQEGRLLRPLAEYTGTTGRTWIPLEQR
jgi:citrate synthase